MKKIMVYSKFGNLRHQNIRRNIKTESGIFLLFVAFVCGIFSGTALMLKVLQIPDMSLSVQIFCENFSQNRYLAVSCVHFGLIWLLSVTGGLGCFGAVSCIISAFSTGAASSAILTYMLNSGSLEGLGKFCLYFLPGIIISTCSVIIFGDSSIKFSSGIFFGILTGRSENSNIRIYIIKALICLVLIIASILVNYVLIRIFYEI